MKITIFNSDGSIRDVRDVNLHVPEYITNFDNSHSFLNITTQEIEELESKEDFVRKTITKELLIQSVYYDYSNFIRKFKIEICQEEIITIFEQSLSDPIIIEGDRIFSSILRIYSKAFRYRVISKEGISELIEEIYHYEKFINVITEDESMSLDIKYYCSIWVRILLSHSAKSASGWRNRNSNCDKTVEEKFYCSFQNLVNRYYYILARLERIGCQLPIGIKKQKDVLKAFVAKQEWSKPSTYYCGLQFFERIICALYATKEQNRGDIYSLAHYFLNSHPFFNRDSCNILSFSKQKVSNPQEKKYTIELFNHHNVIECKYEISDSELFTMRESKDNNDLYKELYSTFESIYEGYLNVDVIKDKWETNVMTDAGVYFDSHPNRRDDWVGYYNFEVGRIREESRIYQNQMKPQRCFFHLLCDYIHPLKELTFSRDVLASVILMLNKIECFSQEGLYECMFKMNYIKRNLPQRDPRDIAVSHAMEYIECLFLPECEFVAPAYQNYIQPLMKRLLNDSKVREKITEVQPHGFLYGFNLKLVYNLLGLLHQSCIIKGGVKKLDKYIYGYNYKKGIEKYEHNERKSYISKWNKDNSEIHDFIGELSEIVSQQINK